MPNTAAPASSSNLGLLTVLFLTLMEWEENCNPCLPEDFPSSKSIAQNWLQFPCSYRVSADLKRHLSQTQTQFRTMNSLLTDSQLVLEPCATSVSSGSDSARFWNILGHSDGSTASRSLGSHTLSSPEDEEARSAVFFRFFCKPHHQRITVSINDFCEKSNMFAYNKLVRIH